ncbi:MAG: hypothetical protein R3C01_14830 [Planctomycetaceae bacterium]
MSLLLRTAPFALLMTAMVTATASAQAPTPVNPYAQSGQGQPQMQYMAPVGQYPRLDAPLYPSPVQNVPSYTSGSIVTNQAFAPHEMMYAHSYHAMYPPYYHKVKGGWFWTPRGMRQHEEWELQGTEVTVNYRSSVRPFSGFIAPRGGLFSR